MTDISVLFPSRGRPSSLVRTVNCLLDLAACPDDIEMLVAVDPDDTTQQSCELPKNARILVAPERYGYTGQQHYYNQMLSQVSANSIWLLNWGDDATMLTSHWDDVIRNEACNTVLWLRANHSPQACCFPAWPRSWSDRLGYITLSPHIDTWIQRLGDYTGAIHQINVDVLHDRFDITGNHGDQTYADGRKLLGTDGMHGVFPEDKVRDDARIIKESGLA